MTSPQIRTQQDLVKVSLGFDEIARVKQVVSEGREYCERMSFGLILRLLDIQCGNREKGFILDEIDFLEGVSPSTRTKEASQFKRSPLRPFWHKHFSTPRHTFKNLGVRWGLDRGGNTDLSCMISGVASEHGHDPEKWPLVLADRLVFEGFVDRARHGLTGDWIIFAIHHGQNYYLDLATHEEGVDSYTLYEKLRDSAEAEFPFLFSFDPSR